ncbi:MAG: 2-C-methyl-D-erythritol 2,4-cyclodiphosphate synthase [Nitrospinae bacterium]|nr:2-C-methyl-D-erythritol 2,4-cyclodiphosphate synthase [Nitrospinota bacterium]MZH40489.1 2-C-methyl-D-erythritol 2,4-cyclodiphosphate synthase [Nitrospinota bacterium]MZH45788.1 2-C-methyl-D-erythritol 2,4-cyclodiphosphate synthase [Nitrospinota bacterium]
MNFSDIRIGNGYDVHRLVEGRKLILGGVDVPHTLGLEGHSDADALVHALCDALLGALGAGDIGAYFPDTDPKWKGISSLLLLKEVMRMCREKGYELSNADTVIVAQKPKLAPHLPEMKDNIASTMGINTDQINIKATTTEKLGFAGREEGIAAYAVALLMKND